MQNRKRKMYIIDKNTMRRAEELAVEQGTEWFTLMDNAGTSAAEFINKTTPVKGKKVLILCGKGNNGGDGFVIAKRLSFLGAEVTVVLTHGASVTDSAKRAFEGIPAEVRIISALEMSQGKYDIAVDAVFGTGYSAEKPDQALTEIFKTLSAQTVYAIDLPSLMSADTGKGYENCLWADYTLTFAAYKYCHILPDSADRCGSVVCLNIGICDRALEAAGAKYKTVDKFFSVKRRKTSFKNSYGTGLSVCGSYGMSGAAIISAKAALRTGIGILKLACVEENYTACAVSLPEAVLIPCKAEDKTYSISSADTLIKELKSADALLIGCGLGRSPDSQLLVEYLLKNTCVPTLLDADGINLIADNIELLRDVKAPLVLTPHPGEMARLMGVSSADVESDRINIASSFAQKQGVYLVLKGANTVVATPQGEVYINVIGNAGMATAGSGDMLAGVIFSLLAQGISPKDATLGGVWLHSAAGDAARDKWGEKSMLPTDMIEELCRLL